MSVYPEAHRVPTVAELRALPTEELVERHDALVARSRETGEAVTDVYLGELGRRMVELQVERALRVALAAFLASAAAIIVALLALVLGL
jgi:hypothetical protein